MGKKPDLTAAMQAASGPKTKAANAAPLPASDNDQVKPKTSKEPPSRAGKKPLIGYFDPAVSKQLKQIALDEETTIQELLREALNDLFRKRGKPSVA